MNLVDFHQTTIYKMNFINLPMPKSSDVKIIYNC